MWNLSVSYSMTITGIIRTELAEVSHPVGWQVYKSETSLSHDVNKKEIANNLLKKCALAVQCPTKKAGYVNVLTGYVLLTGYVNILTVFVFDMDAAVEVSGWWCPVQSIRFILRTIFGRVWQIYTCSLLRNMKTLIQCNVISKQVD